MSQLGGPVSDRKIEPREAVALWEQHFWDDDKLVEWMRNRAQISEVRAREIVAHMEANRA